MTHAPIALTCGEPSGIGPEITARAWEVLKEEHVFFWIGDPNHLPSDCLYAIINTPAEAADVMPDRLPVIQHSIPGVRTPGRPNPKQAQAIIDSISLAVDFVQSGQASAVCTNPINKAALIDGAGFSHAGHTEFLAQLAGVDRVVMMLVSPELRVVPATIHIPIRDVPAVLSDLDLGATIRVVHDALRVDFGIENPRLAVAGLNPHAGEDGRIGDEETKLIIPLLEELKSEGMSISGPYSADTLFHAEARKRYDVAIAMNHDQALIPIKSLAFDQGVNVTLGLPFVRTSPDHGTAFDIAGTGRANPSSLIAALRLAGEMAARRK